MRDFSAYAEFDGFWERFRPETPFGREAKEKLQPLRSAVALEALWDRTQAVLDFLGELEGDEVRKNRISHHLKRLPRFPTEPRPVYDEVELFQFKKFLHNYTCLMDLLSPALRTSFGFSFASEAFARRLDTGRQSPESFYVADAYSAELSRIRAELRETDLALARVRELRAQEIRERLGLDFDSREFLLSPKGALAPGWEDLLRVEPYDQELWALRPLASPAELVLAERRSSLLTQERSREEEVLEELSHEARGELERLREYREAVRNFDLAYARARLARELGLVRPLLQEGPLRIRGGRFLPCEDHCRALGIPYQPLDVDFASGATVIFGSNMGGKTVVLKTLAFLQLGAQMGLYVPAERFETRLFQHFHYIGEGRSREAAAGLSGFGFEIRQLTEAWVDFAEPCLALFDEFARTTHSAEAEALLSALLASLASHARVLALFSTHFQGVHRMKGVGYLRMRGLDRSALGLERAEGADLEERIRLINRHMDYRLIPDDGGIHSSDALAIAALLGADPELTRRAESFLADSHS